MAIKDHIRQLRKAQQMTQEELAGAMGVSCASVSKWESGQCAPDLSTLAALADFFETSVDMLLDHQVRADRLEAMLEEVDDAVERHDTGLAASLCQRILRNYPNDTQAVERCAEAYDRMHTLTREKTFAQESIRQTQRLFTLNKGESDAQRLDRIRSLARKYESIEQYETAMEYYRQSNVDDECSRGIARCLKCLGRNDEALIMASDALIGSIMELYSNICTITEVWQDAEEYGKACAAQEWMLSVMEGLQFSPAVIQILLTHLASLRKYAGDMEAAREAVAQAVRYQRTAAEPWNTDAAAPFLRSARSRKMLASLDTRENIQRIMDGIDPRLAEEARKEASECCDM